MTWMKLSFLLAAVCLVGCPSPASRHVFFGVSEAEPLDPPAAAKMHSEANALWEQRAQAPSKMGEAIKLWQTATIKDHTRSDVLIALSKGYALEHAAKGTSGASARKRVCFNGWKASSQALELTSPAFVRRVERDSAEINQVWGDALKLVKSKGAAALYWYAHYDDCRYPEAGRLRAALARVEALGYTPAEKWPAGL